MNESVFVHLAIQTKHLLNKTPKNKVKNTHFFDFVWYSKHKEI